MLVGYIRGSVADLVWFIALPFFAIGIALGFHHWLPYMATASIAVWITVPHHYATWVRSYGLQDDWTRWHERLTFGAVILVASVVAGFVYIPITMALILLLWDHQHSLMQQHGFARIYDFKAGAGAPSTGRADFWLSVFLYGNLLIVAPIWSELWIAELYRWNLQLPASTIMAIRDTSLALTGAYLVFYVGYVAWTLRQGYRVNPMKYLFLGVSYALWYFVAWQDSLLIYAVAHRIMHGVQYIVMVYWFVDTRTQEPGHTTPLLSHFSLAGFVGLAFVYTLVFHLATGAGLGNFGFGFWNDLQVDSYLKFDPEAATGFVAATAVSAAAALHYWVDSFIWKVSDRQTQAGL